MIVTRTFLIIACLTSLVQPAQAADAGHPAVVELFQSQGCSSCPPANANLMAIADRSDVLALSFGVTYWDDLGWKDTFAKAQFTARQKDYARRLGRRSVFTPQVVVNGRRDGVGADPRAFKQLIVAGDRGAGGPSIVVQNGLATIGAAKSGATADVWLVRYDPRVVLVPVKRGENTGKTLPHRNVVKELVRLGAWRGSSASFRLPPASDPAFRSAILVQLPEGGPIIAAGRS